MRRAFVTLAVLGLALNAASAKPHQVPAKPHPAPAAPKHNFVGFDLQPDKPPATPPSYAPHDETLLDTASVVHGGDTLQWDELWLQTGTPVPQQTVLHVSASCGWRSLTRSPFSIEFMRPSARETLLVDQACAGSVKTASGYPTADAAAADWAGTLTNPHVPPPMPSAWQRSDFKTPPHPDWVDADHRFISIAGDETGTRLFFDRANPVRDGTHVTSQSLAVLGGEVQHWAPVNSPVVALRNVRYDCAARTLTILSQVAWDKLGHMIAVWDTPLTPRGATQSPIISAEIDAACVPGEKPMPDYPSVMAAWGAAHDVWPPNVTLTHAQCLWTHVPDQRRADFLADPAKVDLLPNDEMPAQFAACAIPVEGPAFMKRALQNYGAGRAALADTKLDEATLLAAWKTVPFEQRLRMTVYTTPDELDWRKDLVRGLARQLKYRGDIEHLMAYYRAVAVLDEN